ncbi:MAG: hypothetical protein FWC35_08895 [Proteobacteria bacterium]|nr:hypothetical protein [Pseudomonadota bacterium]
MIGLTYSYLRAIEKRERALRFFKQRQRFAEHAWLFLFGAVAGATLVLVFVAGQS